MKICKHCEREQPALGYCCLVAEVETLRTVTQEAAAMLETEASGDRQTIGSMDADAPIKLVAMKLRGALARRVA